MLDSDHDVPNVIETVSPREMMDNLHQGGRLEDYLETGQWIMKRIRHILLLAGKADITRILDLPCGYGRVARWLRADFPKARLVVCDIDREAVDFCAETFDAKPVYGAERPQSIEVPGRFDLIWCGSLVTHLDRPGCIDFLRFFESVLNPGGVLVFTTQGRFIADKFHRQGIQQDLTDEQSAALLRSYDEHGFGYTDYEDAEALDALSLPRRYGLTLASPSWVCRLLEEQAPKLDLLSFTAGGFRMRWGAPIVPSNGLNAQDFVSCIRISDDSL
jgi:SAM-dependent methyltransferase